MLGQVTSKIKSLCETRGVDSAYLFCPEGTILARSGKSNFSDDVLKDTAENIGMLLEAGELSITGCSEVSLNFEQLCIYSVVVPCGKLVVFYRDTKLSLLRVSAKLLKNSIPSDLSPESEMLAEPENTDLEDSNPEPETSDAPAKKTRLGIWD